MIDNFFLISAVFLNIVVHILAIMAMATITGWVTAVFLSAAYLLIMFQADRIANERNWYGN